MVGYVIINGLHASARGLHRTLVTVQYGAKAIENHRADLTDEQSAELDALIELVNSATQQADALARAIPAVEPATQHE